MAEHMMEDRVQIADELDGIAADVRALFFAISGLGAVNMITDNTGPIEGLALKIEERIRDLSERICPDPDAQPAIGAAEGGL